MSDRVEVSWSDVEQFVKGCTTWASCYSNISGVYAVPRGGLVLGTMLSHSLDVPLLASPFKNCIVVDDIADTGGTLNYLAKRRDIAIACMYYNQDSSFEPDFWKFEKTDKWIHFPWEAESDNSDGFTDSSICESNVSTDSVVESTSTELYSVDWKDNGLTCAWASALMCYWEGNISGYVSWIENSMRRLYLPVVWQYLSADYFRANVDKSALMVASCMYYAGLDDFYCPSSTSYKQSVLQVAGLMKSVDFYHSSSHEASRCAEVIDPEERSKCVTMCQALRSYALGRHHEARNGVPCDPKYDWSVWDSMLKKLNMDISVSNRESVVRKFTDRILSNLTRIDSGK